MKRFTVWSLDVLGNPEDGFEVNDRCKVGSLELPDDATDKQVIKGMVSQGYLTSARFKFDVDGDDVHIDIDHGPTGRPLFSLELEQERTDG